jgi:hypothetical protein
MHSQVIKMASIVDNNFFLEMHSEEEEARENQLTLSS